MTAVFLVGGALSGIVFAVGFCLGYWRGTEDAFWRAAKRAALQLEQQRAAAEQCAAHRPDLN